MPFFGGESLNITEKVKIGGYMYDVQRPEAPFPSADCSNVCDGEHNFSEQLIKVAFAGTKVYQDTVFLHEICHAIVAVYCNSLRRARDSTADAALCRRQQLCSPSVSGVRIPCNKKKKQHHTALFLFLAESKGCVCFASTILGDRCRATVPASDFGAKNSPPDCFLNAPHPLRLRIPCNKKRNNTIRHCFFFWRRARDSNPRTGVSPLHDFQSCSFDQLGQLSIYSFERLHIIYYHI